MGKFTPHCVLTYDCVSHSFLNSTPYTESQNPGYPQPHPLSASCLYSLRELGNNCMFIHKLIPCSTASGPDAVSDSSSEMGVPYVALLKLPLHIQTQSFFPEHAALISLLSSHSCSLVLCASSTPAPLLSEPILPTTRADASIFRPDPRT